jgi:hypothetical protein
MKMCGTCGDELLCCKTGLIIHDERYVGNHHADLHYCPSCFMLYIERALGESFKDTIIHAVIPIDGKIVYSAEFRALMAERYGICL